MLKVKSFLGCFSLAFGGLFIGWFYLIGCIVGMVYGLVSIISCFTAGCKDDRQILGLVLVYCFVRIVCSVNLVNGIDEDIPIKVVPTLVVIGIEICLVLLSMFFIPVSFIFVGGALLIIEFYVYTIVYSIMCQKKKNHEQNERNQV